MSDHRLPQQEGEVRPRQALSTSDRPCPNGIGGREGGGPEESGVRSRRAGAPPSASSSDDRGDRCSGRRGSRSRRTRQVFSGQFSKGKRSARLESQARSQHSHCDDISSCGGARVPPRRQFPRQGPHRWRVRGHASDQLPGAPRMQRCVACRLHIHGAGPGH